VVTPSEAFCAGLVVGFFVFVVIAHVVIWRMDRAFGPRCSCARKEDRRG